MNLSNYIKIQTFCLGELIGTPVKTAQDLPKSCKMINRDFTSDFLNDVTQYVSKTGKKYLLLRKV